MKNLKKLFVVLPLLLVMLLSVVPVMAEKAEAPFEVKGSYVDDARFQAIVNMTKFTEADYVKYLNQQGTLIPVWVGENIPYADSNFDDVLDTKENPVNDRHMNVVVMNGGAVDGWVKANYDAVSPLAVAQQYVETNYPNYYIPTYQIQNVMRFTKLVNVPESWVDLGTEKKPVIEETEIKDAYTDWVFAENALILNNRTAFQKEEFKQLPFFTNAQLDEEPYSVDFNGQTYPLKGGVFDDDVYRYWFEKDLIVLEGAKIQNGITPEVDKKDPLKGTVTIGSADKTRVFAEVEVKREKTKEVVIKETKVKEVAIEGSAKKLVEGKIEGLLIIVEKNFFDLEVTHHYFMADGSKITQVDKLEWPKGKNFEEAIKLIEGFKVSNLELTPVFDNNYLVLGENVVKGYKLHIDYVASEEVDKEQVDAAVANNTANVANAQQLPATGAADSFALVLSSLALVVVGLVIKK
ncbi:MAG: hypothetical protein Q4D97_02840 [Eubacteriales bacterium]|nr:hypothetical protein [Eubacteriales bacterium]